MLGRMVGKHKLAPCSTEGRQIMSSGCPLHGWPEIVIVAVPVEQRRNGIEPLPAPPGMRHDRQSCGVSLQDAVGLPLPYGWEDEDLRIGQHRARVVQPASELDARHVGSTDELTYLWLDRVPLSATVTNDDQLPGGKGIRDFDPRPDKQIGPLPPDEAADVHEA